MSGWGSDITTQDRTDAPETRELDEEERERGAYHHARRGVRRQRGVVRGQHVQVPAFGACDEGAGTGQALSRM